MERRKSKYLFYHWGTILEVYARYDGAELERNGELVREGFGVFELDFER